MPVSDGLDVQPGDWVQMTRVLKRCIANEEAKELKKREQQMEMDKLGQRAE